MHTNYPLASLAVLAALGLAASSLPAAARSPSGSEQASERISYSDLNLASEAGARAMLSRINRAAKSVCGLDTDDELDGRQEYFRCIHATVDRAVTTLQSPLVTALNGAGHDKGQVVLAASKR